MHNRPINYPANGGGRRKGRKVLPIHQIKTDQAKFPLLDPLFQEVTKKCNFDSLNQFSSLVEKALASVLNKLNWAVLKHSTRAESISAAIFITLRITFFSSSCQNSAVGVTRPGVDQQTRSLLGLSPIKLRLYWTNTQMNWIEFIVLLLLLAHNTNRIIAWHNLPACVSVCSIESEIERERERGGG